MIQHILTLKCPKCHGNKIIADGSRSTQFQPRIQVYRCKGCRHKWQDKPSTPTYDDHRAGYLDIEASQLTGSFGILYSWAIKPAGKPVRSAVLANHSLAAEKRLLKSLLKELEDYDLIYTWYGAKFDIPFIRTRCLHHGLDFPGYGSLIHKDLYYVARFKLKMHSNRLAAVAEFLGIQGKTPLDPEVWVKASFGNRRAFRYILKHNEADVQVLEAVHRKLEAFYKKAKISI